MIPITELPRLPCPPAPVKRSDALPFGSTRDVPTSCRSAWLVVSVLVKVNTSLANLVDDSRARYKVPNLGTAAFANQDC